jgi:hypothetical protein
MRAGTAVFTILAVSLSACAGASSAPVTPRTSPTVVPTTPARPAVLAAGAHCQAAVGRAVDFEDTKTALYLRVTLARPRVVDHALSSYARGPSSGHFVIVDTTVQNLSDTGLLVNPTQFVVTTSSGRKVTVESGNGPYSGASRVLDQTYLTPSTNEHGSLIYDSPQAHGRIAFRQAGKAACTWTF